MADAAYGSANPSTKMKKLFASLIVLLTLATSTLAQTAFDFPNTPTANQIVTGPSNQQFQWDGSKWVALLNAGVGGGFTAGGDLSGTSTAQTVIGIQSKAVPAPATGFLQYTGSAFTWSTPSGTFTAGGDLSGTSSSQNVIGIRSTAVPALASGYLHYNGTAFLWDTPAGSGGGAATSVGTTAPASPVIGQLWFNTSDLQTYIWYNDTVSSHWTAIVNQIGSGSGGGGVTSITAGTGLTGGTITTTGTIALNLANANTWTAVQTFSSAPVMSGASITSATIPMAALVNSGVTAQAYTNANITVNAQGLITTASNGTAGASLSGTNTWTANNTFPNTGLLVKGTSGSSATTIAATGTASSAYTATLPANTGTVAELNLAQTWTATQTFPAASIGVAALTGILPIANGGTSTGTAPSSGQILIAQSATSYLPETASLDATINPNGQIVVVGIRGNTIPGLAANTYLHYTSGGAFVWDMPGGATVTGPTAFTPTMYFGGANVGIAYSGAQGTYYQVGKLTLITYQIQLSNKGTSTGGAQMCGLPFPAYTSGNHQGDFPVYTASGFTGLTATLALHLPSGNSCVTLVQTTGANSYSGAITDANMTNSSFFYGSFIYEAN